MSKAPTKSRLSPLHTHTVYSVLDGASSIDQYIKWCQDNGAPGLGVTDHGWVIGAKELYEKAKKAGIVPLPGCEFYVAPDSDYQFAKRAYDYYHVTVFAVNEQGYRNLLKLASKSWDQDEIPGFEKDKKTGLYKSTMKSRVATKWGTQQKPRITFDELLTHHEGLVLGSGCLIGALNKAFLNGEFKGAERNLNRLLEVYKDRMFMEVMPHVCDHDYNRETKTFEKNECNDWSPDGDLQRSANIEIVRLARKYKLPLLMTVDSHFTTPDFKKVQDILLTNGDPNGWRFYNSYHMLTTEQAWEHWSHIHGDDEEQRKIFTEAVENNDVLVEMAKGLTIKDPYQQPTPSIPQDILTKAPTKADALKALLFRQIDYHGRMKWNDQRYVDRLMKEIQVICDNGVADFGNYFGSLEDWARWAAEHSILSAPGRGSGAGSLLCYLLKITHLDPFHFGLPFERFLSDARIKRGKFPDIDWDMGNRDLLVAYLRDRYGDRMAQASTLHTLKVKSAIKDACRSILGWNSHDPRVDNITRMLPKTEPQGVSSKDVLLGYKDPEGNYHDGWISQYPLLDKFFQDHPEVYECVVQLLGIPRAVSRHASAYLIADRPISESAPTCNISGYTCTQYNAAASFNSVEKAGLIKFDFLRVNTLDDISNCIRLVQKRFGYKVWDEQLEFAGEKFTITKGDLRIDQLPIDDKGTVLDIYQLPEDPAVFKELSDGRTETVFQMNSALMTGFTKRIRPKTLMDLSDIVALVRPGPLEASVGEQYKGGDLTMTEAYILRRHGVLPVTYAHPGMEPILKDTYGVAVYQEQLQQMFQDLAGYSPEEADAMREMLAKKKKADVEKAIPELRRRLAERGWTEHQIEVFVSLCISSSAYSFNRAHSASYGMVAYMSAYLKSKFPLEWWCSVLGNSSKDDIREKGYARILLKDGLLQLPHVNGPVDTFRLENGKVHAPLHLIERVGNAACNLIGEARKSGPFKSLQDFFERACGGAVNEGVVHNLIICGAFDQIEPGRTPQDLIEEYQYLKKVVSIRLGKNQDDTKKTGNALKAAVAEYKEKERIKGVRQSVPEMHFDNLQLEMFRVKNLPIYRLNVHEDFQSLLMNKGILYDPKKATFHQGAQSVDVFQSVSDIEARRPGDKGVLGVWVGFLQDAEPFQYTDRKTRGKVTALKMNVTNNGDAVECILWPDLYAKVGPPKEDRIIFVIGTIKPAREPGKWSMSVAQLAYA